MIIRSILVATDLRDGCEAAYAEAISLARSTEAEVVLLHVNELTYYEASSGEEFARYLETANALIRERLERDRAVFRDAGIEVAVLERSGDPHEQIRAVARQTKADLLILGRPVGRSARHIVLGSSVQRILRHADIPVLIARRRAGGSSTTGVGRLLFATDLSEDSARGLQYADWLARATERPLSVCHVLRVPPALSVIPGEPPLSVPVMATDHARAERMEELEALADGLTADVQLHIGVADDVAYGIVDAATGLDAGLIVVPSHGRTALQRLVLGSTSERVLGLAPMSVLVLPRTYLAKHAEDGALSFAS